ncbi:Universal stress protein family protein [Planctomycetes bacterium MalM25]|nr:Universal stress protein family protein [Planctomycetes bacterium MalM25]
MIGKILVGLGGRTAEGPCCSEAATRLAIDLGARHGASLTGMTVADVAQLVRVGSAPIGAGSAVIELREHRLAVTRERVEAAIEAFEAACSTGGVRHAVKREERSEPFDYLISQARYHDLTVIGLHGLFEYGVHGETHYDPAGTMVRLVSGGVRPILAAGPHVFSKGKDGAPPIERVLIAYSGSPQSAKTMRRFVQMNLWPEAKLRIVAFGDDHERRQRHLLHAANYCEAHGIEVERDYRPGDPRTGVLEVADEWEADLIVMGNSHRTLLSRKVLGDTMLETIRRSDRSLFLCQ